MSFVEAVRSALAQYATFRGRARRSEYWWFTLFYVVWVIVMTVVASMLVSPESSGIVSLVLYLPMVIPGIAVTVRRLHDTNRSGAWYLINFVPIVGPIVLLVFMVMDSQPGENQYGPSPKPGPVPPLAPPTQDAPYPTGPAPAQP